MTTQRSIAQFRGLRAALGVDGDGRGRDLGGGLEGLELGVEGVEGGEGVVGRAWVGAGAAGEGEGLGGGVEVDGDVGVGFEGVGGGKGCRHYCGVGGGV